MRLGTVNAFRANVRLWQPQKVRPVLRAIGLDIGRTGEKQNCDGKSLAKARYQPAAEAANT